MSASNQETSLYDIQFATRTNHEEYFRSDKDVEDDGELINTSYLLLDLPTELLERVTNELKNQDGDELQMEFRGRNEDEVVLTLPDKTYQLRTVQNSNSVMICGTSGLEEAQGDDARLGLSVLKVVHETIELTDITKFPGTRLDRVKHLLQPHLYTGETNELQRGQDSSSPITLNSLSEQVRASDAEIQNYLQDLHVVELDGALRMLGLGYLSTILSGLLKALDDLKVGPHEDFTVEPVVDIVTSRLDINQEVFLQILNKYSSNDLSSHSIDSSQTTSLKTEEIVNLIGLSQLLSIKPTKVEPSGNPKEHRYIQTISVDKFLTIWRGRLTEPYRDYCSIKALETHSILSNDDGEKDMIIVIPINKLSLEPKLRISQLFEIQPKWNILHIRRFLSPITGGDIQKKFDELVLKFCRKTKEILPNTTTTTTNQSSDDDKKDVQVSEIVWLTARNKW